MDQTISLEDIFSVYENANTTSEILLPYCAASSKTVNGIWGISNDPLTNVLVIFVAQERYRFEYFMFITDSNKDMEFAFNSIWSNALTCVYIVTYVLTYELFLTAIYYFQLSMKVKNVSERCKAACKVFCWIDQKSLHISVCPLIWLWL